MKSKKKLPRRELKVMMAVWDSPAPVRRKILSVRLARENWTDPTILTMLGRLVDKGFLKLEREGNRNMYTPIISKEEYMAVEAQDYAEKTGGLSLAAMMKELIKARGVTRRELDELDKLLAKYRKKLK